MVWDKNRSLRKPERTTDSPRLTETFYHVGARLFNLSSLFMNDLKLQISKHSLSRGQADLMESVGDTSLRCTAHHSIYPEHIDLKQLLSASCPIAFASISNLETFQDKTIGRPRLLVAYAGACSRPHWQKEQIWPWMIAVDGVISYATL